MYESEFERNLYQQRRDKLRQIAALGREVGLNEAQATYPNSFEVGAPRWSETDGPLIPFLKKTYDSSGSTLTAEQLEAHRIEVSIAGRIMAIRVQGKAGFAQLQQAGQRFQVYVRKDDVGENAFALYKLLDLGDHIGVRGHLFRTRTGELTVHVTHLTFLAKAMLALPDKYHGLEDTELRYRQRYVDLFMNTGATKPATPASQTPVISTGGVADAAAEKPASLPMPDAPDPSVARQPESPQTSTEVANKNAVILSEAPERAAGESNGAKSKDPDGAGPATAASPLSATDIPAVEPETPNVREVFVKRAAILRALRTFFDARGYLEVETPMMQQIAGGAAAQPFTTHHNALDIDLFLRIAPELYLKRLVVGGLDRVYEINRNFRNEGVSTRHNPEFTMLEFYQAYANYHDLIRLTEELIIFVAKEVNGTTITHFNGNEIDLSKWTKLSMREAIIKFWPPKLKTKPSLEDLANLDNFRPFVEALETYFAQERERLLAERERTHNTHHADPERTEMDMLDTRAQIHKITDSMVTFDKNRWTLNRALKYYDGKVYASVFEMLAELELIQPHIIYDFPLAVSPLSKKKPDEPDWVERFEFYIGGFEVGNAFSELNDPDDQRERFLQQVAEKEKGDAEASDMDEDYVRALGYGLPPTAGEGIGIDRLTMVLTNSKSIRDVILFPLMRPQQKTPDQPAAKQEQPHGESAE